MALALLVLSDTLVQDLPRVIFVAARNSQKKQFQVLHGIVQIIHEHLHQLGNTGDSEKTTTNDYYWRLATA